MTEQAPPRTEPPHPGWYPDPWGAGPWRWWDGHQWTMHVAPGTTAGGAARKPRLPSWLSVPVIVGALVAVPLVVLLTIQEPVAILLGLVPLVIVLPVLAWLDRVEPEPLPSRIHAVLWGATVAGTVSGIINSLVAIGAGEVVAAVVSAPVVEEATKGLGIIWALRRHEVDSVTDGIVYAGWVALGFAVVEDFLYFHGAAQDGILPQVFVLRALLTPFAHPLFTAWIGLAIGIAVTRRQSLVGHLAWGYLLAVGTHAAWNGVLSYTDSSGNAAALGIAVLCFIALFVAAVVTVILIRQAERRRFVAAVPMLAERYGMTPNEARVFTDWRTMLATRRRLTRPQRQSFDAVHVALARLASFHARPGPIDFADAHRLVDQLNRSRAAAQIQ